MNGPKRYGDVRSPFYSSLLLGIVFEFFCFHDSTLASLTLLSFKVDGWVLEALILLLTCSSNRCHFLRHRFLHCGIRYYIFTDSRHFSWNGATQLVLFCHGSILLSWIPLLFSFSLSFRFTIPIFFISSVLLLPHIWQYSSYPYWTTLVLEGTNLNFSARTTDLIRNRERKVLCIYCQPSVLNSTCKRVLECE